MRNKAQRLLIVLALALALTFGLLACVNRGGDDVITTQSLEPAPATVVETNLIDWHTAGTAVSTTTYYYGPSVNGTTGENVLRWNQAEIFATIDIVTGTQTFTVTPQMSADGSNWSDLTYTVEEFANSSGAYTQTYQSQTVTRNMAFSADGTNMLSIPLYGKYMRLKTEVLTTAYQVQPVFYVILKNK